jgi:hypothetical protein
VAKNTIAGMTVLRVDPVVWNEALKAANGDAKRIEIRGEFDVVVHNGALPPSQRINRAAMG